MINDVIAFFLDYTERWQHL